MGADHSEVGPKAGLTKMNLPQAHLVRDLRRAERRGAEPVHAGLDGMKNGCVSQPCGLQDLSTFGTAGRH